MNVRGGERDKESDLNTDMQERVGGVNAATV